MPPWKKNAFILGDSNNPHYTKTNLKGSFFRLLRNIKASGRWNAQVCTFQTSLRKGQVRISTWKVIYDRWWVKSAHWGVIGATLPISRTRACFLNVHRPDRCPSRRYTVSESQQEEGREKSDRICFYICPPQKKTFPPHTTDKIKFYNLCSCNSFLFLHFIMNIKTS